MQMKPLAAALAAAMAATPLAAQDTTISGTGTAPVSRDADGVRAVAEEAAKRDLVRMLGRQIVGAEREGELTDQIVGRLATQIRPDMITGRSSERIGQTYRVTLTARMDRQWFQGLLDDEGLASSSAIAGGDHQLIIVMIDEEIGVAPDHSQPAEIVTEYDRDRGASYSDQSTLAYSDRARSADSSATTAGSTARGSYAGGYSDGYGSAAARGSASRANAYSDRSASASSRDTSLIDRTDVEASAHDVESFRQRVTYQSAASSEAGEAARMALNGRLLRHQIRLGSADNVWAGFSTEPLPMYADLRRRPDRQAFFAYAQSQSAPFFMGGTLKVDHEGRHPATNEAMCSGSFAAEAYSTAPGDSAIVGSSTVRATMTGSSTTDCAARLSVDLAERAADEVGPAIQRHWRRDARNQAADYRVASGPAEWTLVVRGGDLGMAAQADLMDALAAVPGIENQTLMSQSATQLDLRVRYSGAEPLNLALFRRLRSSPAFAGMDTQMSPGQLIVCQSGC